MGSSWTWEDSKTLAWEVWKVYKSWGMWVYHKYRPYRPLLTWPNICMGLVTFVAIVAGFWVLFRQHQKKKRLEEERERRLSLSDDFFIKHDQLKGVRKGGKSEEVRSPPNCPFKHLFGGLMDEGSLPPMGEDGAGGEDIMGKLRTEIRKNIDKKRREGNGDGPEFEDLDDKRVRDSDDEEEEEEDENAYGDRPYLTKDGRDPFDLAMHIPSELKKIQNKITTREMEKQLTQDQKDEEARARREQLEQIFKLMQDQKDKFGEQNSTDIEEQMRMYAL